MSPAAPAAAVRSCRVGLAIVAALACVGMACAPAAQKSANTGPQSVATAQLTVVAPAARPQQTSSAPRAGVPDFTLRTIDGGMFQFSEQQGRVVGLFVMASWCGTCIPETQAWERLANEREGLTVVAVSGDPGDTAEDVRRFATLAKAQHLIWTLDPKAEFVHLFQVRSLDTTLIFDRAGQLVYRDSVPTPYDVLRRELDKVL